MHHITSVSVQMSLKTPLERPHTALHNPGRETIEGVHCAVIKSAPVVLGPNPGEIKFVVLACLNRPNLSPTH